LNNLLDLGATLDLVAVAAADIVAVAAADIVAVAAADTIEDEDINIYHTKNNFEIHILPDRLFFDRLFFPFFDIFLMYNRFFRTKARMSSALYEILIM
jgi:predicted nicotinamide N-methyase